VIVAGLPGTMKGRVFPSIGLLLVQIVVGYEWLLSGVTKIVRGGFASGLAGDLREESVTAAGWYRNFLYQFVIPNARVFGWATLATEIMIGVVLITASVLWLTRWNTLTGHGRDFVLLGTAFACAIAMNLNVQLYLASSANVPFFIAESPFDEGVGLDLLLPLLEVIIGGVAFWTWLAVRGARAGAGGLRAGKGRSPR